MFSNTLFFTVAFFKLYFTEFKTILLVYLEELKELTEKTLFEIKPDNFFSTKCSQFQQSKFYDLTFQKDYGNNFEYG